MTRHTPSPGTPRNRRSAAEWQVLLLVILVITGGVLVALLLPPPTPDSPASTTGQPWPAQRPPSTNTLLPGPQR